MLDRGNMSLTPCILCCSSVMSMLSQRINFSISKTSRRKILFALRSLCHLDWSSLLFRVFLELIIPFMAASNSYNQKFDI